ncbi:MAG: phage shock protein [Chloroflexota bacterium]|jgi:phage shock protein C|nr:phage shock protein [Chloroflexota bacterium]
MGETTGGVLRRGSDRILGGVCSGLAVYFGVDPLLVRVVFVILALVPPSIGILLYLVLWFLMEPPQGAPTTTRSVGGRLRAMSDDIRQDFRTGFRQSQASGTPSPTSGDPASGPPPAGPPSHHGRWGPPYGNRPPGLWAGIILIVLGAYFLLTNLGVLSNLRWDLFWPAVLIVLGLLLLVRRR